MASIIMKALFQPSKACNYIEKSDRNKYILTWAFFFSGFFLGSLLAIPYYYLYKDLLGSIMFAFAFAFAGAGASAGITSFFLAFARIGGYFSFFALELSAFFGLPGKYEILGDPHILAFGSVCMLTFATAILVLQRRLFDN